MGNYTLKKPDSIKSRKRVGRGPGSGHGKTSCRGQKGQFSRSGSKRRAWFEGGQMPIQRRVPKRGFNNLFREVFQVVNISSLAKLGGTEITPELLKKSGLVSKHDRKIKILGNGELKTALTVKADAFTKSAEEKIKSAGGSIVIRKWEEIKKTANKAE